MRPPLLSGYRPARGAGIWAGDGDEHEQKEISGGGRPEHGRRMSIATPARRALPPMTAATPPRRARAAPRRKQPAAAAVAAGGRPDPAPEPPTEPEAATWVLQAEAAARTGYSVSAIRKWRRSGAIADRRQIGPGGVERVEVRLEDVEARVALHPPAPPRAARAPVPNRAPAASPAVSPASPPTPGASAGPSPRPSPPPEVSSSPTPALVSALGDPPTGPPPGSAVISLADLEALFRRISDNERRAEQAETRLKEATVEARYMSGQLAELRRQVTGATTPMAAESNGGGHGAPAAARTGIGATATAAAAARPGVGATATAPGPGPGHGAGPATARPPGYGSPDASEPPRFRPSRAEPRARVFELVTLDPAPAPGTRSVPPVAPAVPVTPVTRVAPTGRAVPLPHPAPPAGAQSPGPRSSGPPGTGTPGRAERSAPARRAPEPIAVPDGASRIDGLALELRRLYARLDDYRREPTISPSREAQRERDLGEYDAVLLRACAALSIPVGLRTGEAITLERRGALTQALARVGIDVRVKPNGRVRG